MRKSDPDLTPLPKWKQRQQAVVAYWRRARDSRVRRYATLRSAGSRALTLAISVVGGMLVSFAAWQMYAPAGFLVGGLLIWALQWNHGRGDG